MCVTCISAVARVSGGVVAVVCCCIIHRRRNRGGREGAGAGRLTFLDGSPVLLVPHHFSGGLAPKVAQKV